MTRFMVKRLGAALVTLLVASMIVFLLLRLAKGDPAALIVGDAADEAQLAKARAEMGLDLPLPSQYAVWLGHVAQGDLGRSFMTGEPVFATIVAHFLVTVQLVLPAFVISLFIAVPAGLFAARHKGDWRDNLIVGLSTLFISVPSFWSGLVLARVFGASLGWLPTLGFVSIGENAVMWAEFIILPTIALTLVEVGILTRLVRGNAAEVFSQDYVDYARSKGLSESEVTKRHVFKNSMAPTLPMVGLVLSSLLSGTAVVETIFGVPGIGRLLVDAIYARDYPVIQGVLLFVAAIYTIVNIAVDLMVPLFDPRARA